jgi:hypothetical protein
MAFKVLRLVAILMATVYCQSDACSRETEEASYPVSFEGLRPSTDEWDPDADKEETGIHAAIVDDTDEEVIYLGGFVGSQPLLAKVKADTMDFMW